MRQPAPELRRLGSRVRDYRRSLGWSQARLSEECGLHFTYISHIELGIRNPTLLIVHRLADALGVPVAELVMEVGWRY